MLPEKVLQTRHQATGIDCQSPSTRLRGLARSLAAAVLLLFPTANAAALQMAPGIESHPQRLPTTRLSSYSHIALAPPIQTGSPFTFTENISLYRTLHHNAPVTSLAFSPGGNLLATAGEDRMVKLWDAATGRLLRILGPHSRGVSAVVFSPDGKKLLSWGDANFARVWDPKSGRQVGTLQGQCDGANALAYSPDGNLIAAAGSDRKIKLLDASSGELTHEMGMAPWNGDVQSLVFSPDSRTVACAGPGVNVTRWNTRTGHELRLDLRHDAETRYVAYSPDGKLLASVGSDGRIKVCDGGTGTDARAIGVCQDELLSVAFSRDGHILAAGGKDRVVHLWNPAAGQQVGVLRGQDGSITSLAFSSDGRFLASGGQGGTIRLWNWPLLRRNVEQASHHGLVYGEPPDLHLGIGNVGPVVSLEYSPDGKIMAAGGADRTIKLWDTGSGREIRTLNGSTGAVKAHFLPGSRIIAGASDDGTIRFWDLQSGRMLRTNDSQGWPMAFSPDGRTAASGNAPTGEARILNLLTGRASCTLRGHTGAIFCLAFSPNGRRVATGSNDSTARIWDVLTGRLLRTFEPPL